MMELAQCDKCGRIGLPIHVDGTHSHTFGCPEPKPLSVEEVDDFARRRREEQQIVDLAYSAVPLLIADWRRFRAALEKCADGEHWNECPTIMGAYPDGECCKQHIARKALWGE